MHVNSECVWHDISKKMQIDCSYLLLQPNARESLFGSAVTNISQLLVQTHTHTNEHAETQCDYIILSTAESSYKSLTNI